MITIACKLKTTYPSIEFIYKKVLKYQITIIIVKQLLKSRITHKHNPFTQRTSGGELAATWRLKGHVTLDTSATTVIFFGKERNKMIAVFA